MASELSGWANSVLSEFGQSIGLTDLALDENNYCCIGFESQILNIEIDEARKEFLLYAEVAELPSNFTAENLLGLLQANYYGLLTGPGSIGIDRAASRIYFVDRVLCAGFDAKSFERRVSDFVARVEGWQSYLGELEPAPIETPAATEPLSFFRI